MRTAAVLAMTFLVAGVFPALGWDDEKNGDKNVERNVDDKMMLEFGTMVGNSGAFVGSKTPIRGINAGGAPWVVTGQTSGHLKADGELHITVRGLVLANDPSVPANQRLTNPVPDFRAIVSCLGLDGLAHNIMTGTFPADVQGNAIIDASVLLPQTCVAPIVFVTSPGGAWFAATGK